MKISIVIPSFCRETELEANIYFWQSEISNFDAEILIANASNYIRLKKIFANNKAIKFLDVDRNFWWSESVNFSVNWALESDSEFIVITNDDMIYPKGILNFFLQFANSYDVLTIPQLQVDGTIYYGALIDGFFKIFSPLKNLVGDCEFIDITNGSCLFIPSVVFKKIGVFNSSHLPHYYSDTEFLLRLKKEDYKLKLLNYNYIIQGPPTEFTSRFSMFNIFYHKGSPLNLRAVIFFGLKLYGNFFNLFFWSGFKYSFEYIVNVIKFQSKKIINTIKLDNA